MIWLGRAGQRSAERTSIVCLSTTEVLVRWKYLVALDTFLGSPLPVDGPRGGFCVEGLAIVEAHARTQ